MFKDRLYEAMALRDMKAVELAKKINVSKGTISNYLSGYAKPKSVRLFDIAQALDVSEPWLIGYDVPMEREPREDEAEAAAQKIINDRDLRLLMYAAILAKPEHVRSALAFIKTLQAQDNSENG